MPALNRIKSYPLNSLLQYAAHRDVPVKLTHTVRPIMSRLAGLINKEKNRKIVSSMFSSDSVESKPNTEPLSANPLSEHLVTLERVIFEEGVMIDKTRSEVLISELEAVIQIL
jgi:hypothetical protein